MRRDSEQDYIDYVSARLPALQRAAYLLCGDAHRADDIVQTTITALYVRWRRVRTVDNIDGYVHRMLVRKYIDERRLRWARVRLTSRTPEHTAPPDDTIEDRDAVVAALRRLPRGQRAVVVLRFLCDMSIDDVATSLRCSRGNVKSQTARGLAALRGLLDAESLTTVNGGSREESQ